MVQYTIRVAGVSPPTIQRWLDRYDEDGLAGFEDRSRSRKPRKTTTTELEAEIVRRRFEEKPPPRGAPEHAPDGRVHGTASQPSGMDLECPRAEAPKGTLLQRLL